MDPYYKEACDFLGLYGNYFGPDGSAGYNFTAEFWTNELGQEVAQMENFEVEMYQFVPRQNLQFQALKVNNQTIGESKARVILNAGLLNIDAQNGSVRKITVGVMGGDKDSPVNEGQFSIYADAIVLACGAVANARQLLLSDIGNENDLVGRYLAGQPIANGAFAVSTSPNYLSAKEQQLLSYQNPNNSGKSFPISLLAGLLTPSAEAVTANRLGSCWFNPSGTEKFYHGLLPERESRITLSDQKDPVFGQQQSKATWVLSPDEKRNYDTLTNLFKEAVIAKGGGPVTISDWSKVEDKMVYNGHHLCTTRMSESPLDGVVDKNLKVHSMDNLYCAGSSVWTSAGVVNPTFSIVAFSIRLAEHLATQLKASKNSSEPESADLSKNKGCLWFGKS